MSSLARNPLNLASRNSPLRPTSQSTINHSAFEIHSRKLMPLRERLSHCRIRWTALALLLMLVHITLAAGCFGLGCFGGKQKGHEQAGESHEGNPETSKGRPGEGPESVVQEDLLCEKMHLSYTRLIWLPKWFSLLSTVSTCDSVCQYNAQSLEAALLESQFWSETSEMAKCNYGYACILWHAPPIELQNASARASTSQPVKKPPSPKRVEERDEKLPEWVDYIRRTVGLAPAVWLSEEAAQIRKKHPNSESWRFYTGLAERAFEQMVAGMTLEDIAEPENDALDKMCRCHIKLRFEQVVKQGEPQCTTSEIMRRLRPLTTLDISVVDGPQFQADSTRQCDSRKTTWPTCDCQEPGRRELNCIRPKDYYS